MHEEKHREALKEVEQTISDALKGDVLDHQRRLMSMISLGIQHCIELYFHTLRIIKPGAYVKHEWFKMSEHNAKAKLSAIITKKIDDVPNIHEILFIARGIEKDRNEIVYGAPLGNDRIMRNKIDQFLEMKKLTKGDKNGQV